MPEEKYFLNNPFQSLNNSIPFDGCEIFYRFCVELVASIKISHR